MSDDNIPMKESKHGGIPVTDVESAQKALLDSMRASKEQPETVEEETETQDIVLQLYVTSSKAQRKFLTILLRNT